MLSPPAPRKKKPLYFSYIFSHATQADLPQNPPRLLAEILQIDDRDLDARELTDPDLLTAVERTLIPQRHVLSGVEATGF